MRHYLPDVWEAASTLEEAGVVTNHPGIADGLLLPFVRSAFDYPPTSIWWEYQGPYFSQGDYSYKDSEINIPKRKARR